MSMTLILACLWVLAATLTAFLPMRTQMGPGLALLLAAPVLLYFIARDHGFIVLTLALLAFLSMFRRPLMYLAKRAMGRPAEPPKS